MVLILWSQKDESVKNTRRIIGGSRPAQSLDKNKRTALMRLYWDIRVQRQDIRLDVDQSSCRLDHQNS